MSDEKPKGRHGGARPNSGGARPGAGRPKNPPVLLPKVAAAEMTALDFLQQVMESEQLDVELRLRAAGVLARYRHPKASATKKATASVAAKTAVTGRFTPNNPPLKLVDR